MFCTSDLANFTMQQELTYRELSPQYIHSKARGMAAEHCLLLDGLEKREASQSSHPQPQPLQQRAMKYACTYPGPCANGLPNPVAYGASSAPCNSSVMPQQFDKDVRQQRYGHARKQSLPPGLMQHSCRAAARQRRPPGAEHRLAEIGSS